MRSLCVTVHNMLTGRRLEDDLWERLYCLQGDAKAQQAITECCHRFKLDAMDNDDRMLVAEYLGLICVDKVLSSSILLLPSCFSVCCRCPSSTELRC